MAKKPTSKDWHRADIIAAVRKTGTSVQALSFMNGYRRTTLGHALVHPYPKCERIIAEHLGVPPQKIWPSRYHQDGSPKSGRNARGLGRYISKAKRNGSTVKKSRNVNVDA
jgi:Ner family transcriptional regulator